jgi:MoxR-like ATPase
VNVGFPNAESELQILRLSRQESKPKSDSTKTVANNEHVSLNTIMQARQESLDLHMAESVEKYIVDICCATRNASQYGEEFSSLIEYGVSPRATIALDRCSRAVAWLNGKDFVSPDDVQSVVHDVLRHRLILSFEAQAKGYSPDQVIDALVSRVSVS